MNPQKETLAVLALCAALIPGPPAAQTAAEKGSGAVLKSPLVMIRILRVVGTGPDQKEHLLYNSSRGVVLPLFDLGQLGERIGTTGLPPDGTYQLLRAELEDEIILLDHGLKREHKPIRGDNRPIRAGIRGSVRIQGAEVHAEGLALEQATAHAIAFATLNKSEAR